MPIIINSPSLITVNEGDLDTSDATASQDDILLGETAYNNGVKITGTIPSIEATTYTPGLIDQIIDSGSYISEDQVILGDANLLESNIKSGVTIFNITGTYEGGDGGSSTGGHIELMRCSGMTSVNDVLDTYSSIIKVSNDGSYETFTDLGPYVENSVSAVYYASGTTFPGVSVRSKTAKVGYYYITPVEITSSHLLYELRYNVSSWMNPSIKIDLISATSADEVPAKLAAGDFAYTANITLANANNDKNAFFEITNVTLGTYYISVRADVATGGNVAIIGNLSIIQL